MMLPPRQSVVPRFSRRPRRSSVPVNRRAAAAHSGSQEPALRVRRARRPSDQRAARALTVPAANRVVLALGMPIQLSSE
jgi:hypothetical protein